MLAAGTVVTGTGPLAGAGAVPRFHLPLAGATQFHADIGWLLGGLAVPLAVGLRLTRAPAPAVRLGWALLALIGLQGMIGYIQYFSGLPAGLVWVHVCGSTLIWIVALRLMFALRDRGAWVPKPGSPGQPAPPSPPPSAEGGQPGRAAPAGPGLPDRFAGRGHRPGQYPPALLELSWRKSAVGQALVGQGKLGRGELVGDHRPGQRPAAGAAGPAPCLAALRQRAQHPQVGIADQPGGLVDGQEPADSRTIRRRSAITTVISTTSTHASSP